MTRFLAHENCLWRNKSECIDDDLALDRLNGVDHDSYRARGELLERLLGIDIDGGEPAPKTRMRVIPAND